MASENVDLVRSIYSAWEEGEFGRTAEWADPEIEWVNFGGPAAGGRTGIDGVEGFWEEVLGSWEQLRASPQRYIEVDQDRVLVVSRLSGRSTDGETEIEHERAGLFRISHGRVTRVIFYWEPARAYADLGLEPDGPPE